MSSQQELKKLSKRKPRISVRKLDKKTVLIEGVAGWRRKQEVSYFLRTQNSDFISIGYLVRRGLTKSTINVAGFGVTHSTGSNFTGNATLQELVDKSFQINKSSWTSSWH